MYILNAIQTMFFQHHIPGKDPHIHRHEFEHMPGLSEPVGSWGFAPLDDWAQGPIPNQTPF